MTHYPLLEHVAGKGKAVIVSTGTATMAEVADMVETARRVGVRDLALMQCTAAYPAPLDSLNLRTIPAMRDRFGVPVGLSDHSRDPVLGPVAACALGASLLEKHFTLSNRLPGPDHAFALEPAELAQMVRAVRDVETTLGSGEKEVQPIEAELRAFARRSVFTVQPVKAGEPFTVGNVAVLRCGTLTPGLEPREFTRVLTRRAARDLDAEQPVTADECA